ncbi:PiggyBac transposable element-derived protein 3 [Trichinella zimbabwensis]|uniref:PiggyBac transposable element-derived protein 3 n=1 Tax=Trichinella zimbabwensis TaxID=268475 RepID=A0A0V1H8S1_9BILA|nr:PiggyBac transposable element-derived protein 3 [Trichinella zimbabwensis]
MQRYSQSQKKHIKIRVPEIVGRYNTLMGGIGILDKLLSSYRPHLRAKKWWWNLFSNALNVAVVAAWGLDSELHQGIRREDLDCAIDGFPVTPPNYTHAVKILITRFG